MAYENPKTIEELKAFCAEKGMPLEQMRFFIGEDYREPRAFGIYRDEDGNFVVYKNKDNGSRAVRYQGPDEAYAVKELYEKLKSEVALRRGKASPEATQKNAKARKVLLAIFAVIFGFYLILFIHFIRQPQKGYYQHQSQTYYYDSHDWYFYDTAQSSWTQWDEKEDWTEEPKDYYLSSKYDNAYGVEDFKDSQYYSESSGSDWDYDYGGWDSNDTNWSSDW